MDDTEQDLHWVRRRLDQLADVRRAHWWTVSQEAEYERLLDREAELLGLSSKWDSPSRG